MSVARTYRRLMKNPHLAGYRVRVRESDLYIQSERASGERVREAILRYRAQIENHIASNPEFLTALAPIPVRGPAPRVIREMSRAASAAGVGPMAAVAGALAERVGRNLLAESREVLVENGGDIFVSYDRAFTLAIDAGDSPLSYKMGIRIEAAGSPLGICTSSGTVGHSFSYGKADAVCVVSSSCALADAAATAIANRVAVAADINDAIGFGKGIRGVRAIVIVVDERIGLWGEVSLVPLKEAVKPEK